MKQKKFTLSLILILLNHFNETFNKLLKVFLQILKNIRLTVVGRFVMHWFIMQIR